MTPPSTADALPHDDSPATPPSVMRERISQLLSAAQEGDSAAIGELLESYRGYLRSIARRRMSGSLVPRLDPSDLVQQTMLEAHQGIEGILTSEHDHLKMTLRRILTCNIANAIRDHLLTDKRAQGRECAGSGLLQERSGGLTSPSLAMVRKEEMQQFAKLLDRLPEDQATALRMRYFEFASVGEIGETLGRSRTAAAGLLKRGLAELRKHVAADPS
ncbi:sigma-70 family RNA polymerase sigma factor [Roseiconus nitratireducens]|uniref:Sigma-70 family RNA polymerase sigma factor n=1 Tax=Roseiconus nitratireducens TaxID=2605748 RepID=A0A5M6CRZ0_9BACT|nr:sigma-70 family RNA polymerase sigma factor [Roseiconus nitratireducens]KAA5537964.1 sigma-70 family RNA polymerase sigma factor [Roseiconus nitratireducens]